MDFEINKFSGSRDIEKIDLTLRGSLDYFSIVRPLRKANTVSHHAFCAHYANSTASSHKIPQH